MRRDGSLPIGVVGKRAGTALVAAVLTCAVIALPAAGSNGAGDQVAGAAKKCKKKHGHKKKCRKKRQQGSDSGSSSVPPPKLSISPTSHDFGYWMDGATSTTFTFVVTNTGGLSSNVALHMTGANTDAFAFVVATNTCGPSLAIGASCHFGVEFDAMGSGIRSATLNAIGLYGVTASATITGHSV
jgi:hypothetical protein